MYFTQIELAVKAKPRNKAISQCSTAIRISQGVYQGHALETDWQILLSG
jgi:hypothetical protein